MMDTQSVRLSRARGGNRATMEYRGEPYGFGAPEPSANIIVQLVEGPLGGSIAIVVGPSPQQRVELSQERLLGVAHRGVNQLSDLFLHCLDFALGRCDQEFIPIFAHGVPQKVKARSNVGQDGLLL